MKRLNKDQIAEAFSMPYQRKERWDKLPFVWELKANNLVTLDMQPNFVGIAKSYKEAKVRHEAHNLTVWKVNTYTGRKSREYVNPLY